MIKEKESWKQSQKNDTLKENNDLYIFQEGKKSCQHSILYPERLYPPRMKANCILDKLKLWKYVASQLAI